MANTKQKQHDNPAVEKSSASAAGRARQTSNQVFGAFRDRDSAEKAYYSLAQRGYGTDDVNLVMSEETRRRFFPDEEVSEFHSKAMEGAGAGAAIGGTAIGILGAVVAVGTSLAVPGLGLVLAGPLVAGLAGAGAGGIAGGLIGALIGWGIPEDRVKLYEKEIKDGGIVMSVAPRNADDATFVEGEWKKNRASNISR